jgi:DNA-directed RNA polymerase subunit L
MAKKRSLKKRAPKKMKGGVIKFDPETGDFVEDGTLEPVYTYPDGQSLDTMQQPFTTTQSLKLPAEFGVLNQIITGTLNDDDLQNDIDETIDLFMETNSIEASVVSEDKLNELDNFLHKKYDSVIKAREQTFFAISDAIDIRNMYTDFVMNKDQQQDVQAFQATDRIFVTHNTDKISLTNKYRVEEFDMYQGICTRTVKGSLSEIPIVVYYYNDTNIEFKVEPEDHELAGKLRDAINSEKKDAKCTYLLFPPKTAFNNLYDNVNNFVDVTGIENIDIPTDINDVLLTSGINIEENFKKIAEIYTGLALIATDVSLLTVRVA